MAKQRKNAAWRIFTKRKARNRPGNTEGFRSNAGKVHCTKEGFFIPFTVSIWAYARVEGSHCEPTEHRGCRGSDHILGSTSSLHKETSCLCGTMVPMQCVSVDVVYADLRAVSSLLQWSSHCMYTCTYGTQYRRSEWARTPLTAAKKDMGGLHCMNNTLFTLYCALSGTHTACTMWAHTHIGSQKKKAKISLCRSFLRLWMNGHQACYANTIDVHIQQKYSTKKSIAEPFMWNEREVSNKKHRTNKQHREVSKQQV